jgi:hypothetical protein
MVSVAEMERVGAGLKDSDFGNHAPMMKDPSDGADHRRE